MRLYLSCSTAMKAPISLIISFYNNIGLLRIIFAALEKQTFKEFEVVIADDGSNSHVVKQVQKMAKSASFPVHHCWHDDVGWRKNLILNQAIVKSEGDYLIFIDGDCIPHRCFIEEHVDHRQRGVILTGRRVQLTKKLSKQLTEKGITSGEFEQHLKVKLLFSSLYEKNLHIENAFRIKRPYLRKLLVKDKAKGILGCNFSVFKDDILSVNGFDERFIHPGTGEDTDLDRRMQRAGIMTLSKKHLLTVYHIYHKRFNLNHQPNLNLLEENDRNGVTFTPYGIHKKPVD